MALEFTQRFRRQVSPYNVVQSLAVLSGSNYCPALQTITSGGTPNIDRATCPTVIQAVVSATASDNSGSVASVADSAITNVKWMVQRGDESAGTDITLHSDWAGKFTIGTGADKGKLTVTMNVPAGTTWKIWMECDISDQRRGYTVAIPVVTDSVLLYSIADTSDQYTMSTDRPSGEIYEPARDQRLIDEYLTGLGVAHTFNDDGNTYLRTVTASLRKGGVPVSSTGYTIKVYSIGATGLRTEVTSANDDCINSIIGNEISFDLRFSAERTYQIACFVSGNEVAHKTYGWAWSGEMPTTDEGIVGGATYADGTKQTFKPKFNFGKGLLKYPTIAFSLQWFWHKPDTSIKTYIGSGEQQTFDLTNTSMFYGSEVDAVLSIEKKGAFNYLCNENGDRFVDENGYYLIAN